MMELVPAEHAGTFDHAELVDSYRSLDEHIADYIVSFAELPAPPRLALSFVGSRSTSERPAGN